jgi:hypothetical protein
MFQWDLLGRRESSNLSASIVHEHVQTTQRVEGSFHVFIVLTLRHVAHNGRHARDFPRQSFKSFWINIANEYLSALSGEGRAQSPVQFPMRLP